MTALIEQPKAAEPPPTRSVGGRRVGPLLALLWQDARWFLPAIIIAAVAFPLAAFLERRHVYGIHRDIRDAVVASLLFAAFVAPVALALFKGRERRNPMDLVQSHLPFSRMLAWAAQTTALMLMAMSIFGCYLVTEEHLMSRAIARNELKILALVALWYTAAVLAAYIGAQLSDRSFALGKLVIPCWFIGAIMAAEDPMGRRVDLVNANVGALLASVVATSFLFEVALRRKPMKFRTMAATLPAVLYIILVAAPGVVARRDRGLANMPIFENESVRLDSPDWAQSVTMITSEGSLTPHAPWVLEYRDLRRDLKLRHAFPRAVNAIDLTAKGDVYVVQQGPTDLNMRLLLWHPQTDTVRTLATIPAGPHVLAAAQAFSYPSGRVSPDGRYVLLSLRSQVGAGFDNWLADVRDPVRSGELPSAKLVWPNSVAACDEVSWTDGQANIYGERGYPLEISLKDGTARLLTGKG